MPFEIGGATGPTGYTGYTGAGNFTGATGYTGYTGAGAFTGSTGYTGFTGAIGATGYTGYTGAGNFTGYTGYTGFTGYTGAGNFTGYTGYTGPDGAGPTGYTGYTGYTGAGNFTGYTGPTGYTGYTGAGNFTGYTGYTGFTGYTGYTGAAAAGGDKVVYAEPTNGRTTGSITSAPGTSQISVIRMADAATTDWYPTVKVPSGATSITSITLHYSENATSGNVVIRFYTARVNTDANSAILTDQTDTGTATAIAAGGNDVQGFFNAPAGSFNDLTGIDADDLISIRVTRLGNDASDTYATNFDITGLTVVFA